MDIKTNTALISQIVVYGKVNYYMPTIKLNLSEAINLPPKMSTVCFQWATTNASLTNWLMDLEHGTTNSLWSYC